MRTVVATGVTSGCGLASLKQLIARDDGPYNVIVGSRRPETTQSQSDAKELLGLRRSNKTTITYVPLDLLSLESIEKFPTLVKERLGPQTEIDILLHCAGVISTERTLLAAPNGQKTEETLLVNSLAPALLTRRLLDSLSPTARVVLVSSYMHTQAPQNATPRMIDDQLAPGQWSSVRAYAASKLVLMHFSLILKNDPAFAGRTVVSLHPGFIPDTGLIRKAPSALQFVFKSVLPWLPGVSTVNQGGQVIIRAMTETDLPNGSYLEYKGPSQYAPQLDKVELRQQWRQWLAEQGVW